MFMADTSPTAGATGAIIPAGSQLSDPVAAGAPIPSDDPLANPSWLNNQPQQNLDADPLNPGVDVFGSNQLDASPNIPMPGSLPAPVAANPSIPSAAPAPTIAPPVPALPAVSAAATQPPIAQPPAQAAASTEQTFNPNSPFNNFPDFASSDAAPAVAQVPLAAPVPPTVGLAQATQPQIPAVPPAPVPLPVSGFTQSKTLPPIPNVLDPKTLAAAVNNTPNKSQALSNLADKVVSPKSRRNIYLIVIFILLGLVIALASAVLYYMLRGPVSVNITTTGGSTGTSLSTNTSSNSTISTTTTSVEPGVTVGDKVDLIAYMVLPAAQVSLDPTLLNDLPADSIQVGEDYLVPVVLQKEADTQDPVAASLTALFAIKSNNYADTKYVNYLSRANLQVTTSRQGAEDAEWIIKLTGDFTVANSADIAYAKEQIERTIENFVFKYKIELNGKESDYTCLGNSSPSCGN